MTSTKDHASENAAEVARRGPSMEQLRDVTDFESAVALMREEFGATVVSADILGDGFSLLEGDKGKDTLIGTPLMFVSWQFAEGEYGEFVSARVIAELPNRTYGKYVINDGGTGICAQLRDLSNRAPDRPQVLAAPRGLRKSEYDHPIHGHGVTYYIDTAANAR